MGPSRTGASPTFVKTSNFWRGHLEKQNARLMRSRDNIDKALAAQLDRRPTAIEDFYQRDILLLRKQLLDKREKHHISLLVQNCARALRLCKTLRVRYAVDEFYFFRNLLRQYQWHLDPRLPLPVMAKAMKTSPDPVKKRKTSPMESKDHDSEAGVFMSGAGDPSMTGTASPVPKRRKSPKKAEENDSEAGFFMSGAGGPSKAGAASPVTKRKTSPSEAEGNDNQTGFIMSGAGGPSMAGAASPLASSPKKKKKIKLMEKSEEKVNGHSSFDSTSAPGDTKSTDPKSTDQEEAKQEEAGLINKGLMAQAANQLRLFDEGEDIPFYKIRAYESIVDPLGSDDFVRSKRRQPPAANTSFMMSGALTGWPKDQPYPYKESMPLAKQTLPPTKMKQVDKKAGEKRVAPPAAAAKKASSSTKIKLVDKKAGEKQSRPAVIYREIIVTNPPVNAQFQERFGTYKRGKQTAAAKKELPPTKIKLANEKAGEKRVAPPVAATKKESSSTKTKLVNEKAGEKQSLPTVHKVHKSKTPGQRASTSTKSATVAASPPAATSTKSAAESSSSKSGTSAQKPTWSPKVHATSKCSSARQSGAGIQQKLENTKE